MFEGRSCPIIAQLKIPVNELPRLFFPHQLMLIWLSSSTQLWWVVPHHVLPPRLPHFFPNPRGAPWGSVWWRHIGEQHQVPLQQQPDGGGTRHELGPVWSLEPGMQGWRHLWDWDQDGGVPVWPGWQHPQRRALPLLLRLAEGQRGLIWEDADTFIPFWTTSELWKMSRRVFPNCYLVFSLFLTVIQSAAAWAGGNQGEKKLLKAETSVECHHFWRVLSRSTVNWWWCIKMF